MSLWDFIELEYYSQGDPATVEGISGVPIDVYHRPTVNGPGRL